MGRGEKCGRRGGMIEGEVYGKCLGGRERKRNVGYTCSCIVC